MSCTSLVDLAGPFVKSLGAADVVTFDYADWLGADERIETATVAVEPGITNLVVDEWQLSADRRSILVAYRVTGRQPRLARILATARSSNPNRVAANRAVTIEIR